MRKLLALALVVVAFVFFGCENATEKRKRMEENFAQQNYQGAISIAQEFCDPKDLNSCKILADSYFNTDNYTNAFKIYYETLCNADDQYGCHLSGAMKIEGLGVEPDIDGGLKILDLSCGKGYANSCKYLAGFYNNEKKDYYSLEKSIDYLRKACHSGDQQSCGKVQEIENLIAKARAKDAEEKKKKTADLCLDNKNGDACFEIAKNHLDNIQFSSALEYFEKACEYGNNTSCIFAGRLRIFGNEFALVDKEKALRYLKKACEESGACLDYLQFVQTEFNLSQFPKSERDLTLKLSTAICDKDPDNSNSQGFYNSYNNATKLWQKGLDRDQYLPINDLAIKIFDNKSLDDQQVANSCYVAGIFKTQDDDFGAGQEYFLRSCYFGKREACKIAEQNLKGEKNIQELEKLYTSICFERTKKRPDGFRASICQDGANFFSRLKNFNTAKKMLHKSCDLGNFKSCYLLAIGNSDYQSFGAEKLAYSSEKDQEYAIYYYAQYLLTKGQKIPSESFEKIVDYCQSGLLKFCELQQAIGGSGEKQ